MSESVEMGPVDYILIEWSGGQPTGEAVPHLVDLTDRGIIRIIDLAFVTKDEDGNVAGIEHSELAGDVTEFEVFAGASSGLLGEDDLEQAAAALEPGTSAALLVYENTWAAPLATALRNSGAQMVASGRIPVEDLLAALDAVEAGA